MVECAVLGGDVRAVVSVGGVSALALCVTHARWIRGYLGMVWAGFSESSDCRAFIRQVATVRGVMMRAILNFSEFLEKSEKLAQKKGRMIHAAKGV